MGYYLVCGSRQAGKTSLIMRTHAMADHIEKSMRAVVIDFQSLKKQIFDSLDEIWRTIASSIADQLMLDDEVLINWNPQGGYNRNFTTFLKHGVFKQYNAALLLCLDEVDRVFGHYTAQDFFASIRAFYNRGAIDKIWKNVRWVLSSSTEPAFFIEDITQSPFNIGYRLELNCFSAEQTAELAMRHGISLTQDMQQRVMNYIGGRPYLAHLLFYNWVRKPEDWEKLFDVSTAGSGIFKDHLHRFLIYFQKEPEMAKKMIEIINGFGCDDIKTATRFESAGLVKRDENNKVVPLCELYAEFFKKVLG